MMLTDLRPPYGRPGDARLAFAGASLSTVEQFIVPGSSVFASVLVRALLSHRCTTAEALWAIYDRIATGRYIARTLKDLPNDIGYLVTEQNPPAGLALADGVLHIDGKSSAWGDVVITLPNEDETEQARRADLSSEMVVITTAGDLWKAYSQRKQPCFQFSGISLRPGGNTPIVACTDDAAEAMRTALDRAQALVTTEGGDKAAAMEKLIARVQLQAGMDKPSVINMHLPDFVAVAIGRNKAPSPAGAIKAGEAFRQATKDDPEARASWERTRERLQAFGKAMQAAMDSPEYQVATETKRQQWQDLADAIHANMHWAGDELAARHFARPETIADWEQLARIVEIPAETIRTGNLTARDIFAFALAWAERQTIKAKLAIESETAERERLFAELQLQWDNLALAYFYIYRDLFPWFGQAMLEAGFELGERTHSPEVLLVRRRADAAWTEITNLSPLHTTDAWDHAARAAGCKGTPGDIGSAAAAIKSWAAAKLANMPPGTLARLVSSREAQWEGSAASLDAAGGSDSLTGFLGGTALANALGIHATRRNAFFRQLERQRMSLGDDCWHEVRDSRPNSPRYLYRADSPKVRTLAAGYKRPKLA